MVGEVLKGCVCRTSIKLLYHRPSSNPCRLLRPPLPSKSLTMYAFSWDHWKWGSLIKQETFCSARSEEISVRINTRHIARNTGTHLDSCPVVCIKERIITALPLGIRNLCNKEADGRLWSCWQVGLSDIPQFSPLTGSVFVCVCVGVWCYYSYSDEGWGFWELSAYYSKE